MKMTPERPKCPLCGGTPQFATKDIDCIEMCQILCKCGLATEANWYWLNPKDDPEEDELRAWKDWEELVSKFPAIMRIKEGDMVEIEALYCKRKVVVNYVSHFISAQNFALTPAETITKWPWELEQKGGEQ